MKVSLAVVTVTCLAVMSAAVFYPAVQTWAGNLVHRWTRGDSHEVARNTHMVTIAIFGLVWLWFMALIAVMLER